MKRILLLLLTTTVVVVVLAPAAVAQVWPSAQPPQAPPPPAPTPPAPPPPAPPAAPEKTQDDQQAVSIQEFNFSPDQITVEAGTTVTWTNEGSAMHTVTADDGSFDSGTLEPGQSFSHTFEGPGTVAYHCEIHREMTASVTVSGTGATDSKGATQPPKVKQEPTKQASSSGGWLYPALSIAAIVVVAGALGWVILRRRAS